MAIETGEYISRETLAQFIDADPGRGTISDETGQINLEVPYSTALEHFEADLLKGLLKRHAGNIDSAAREAGMNMVTMYRKIKRYGIRKEEY